MDLSKYLNQENKALEEGGQRMSKEEYAAMKKQEREEVWAEIDAKAQDVFKDGDSLKGFLNFMAQCTPQKTANLLLLYSQNPEIRQIRTYERIRADGHSIKPEARGKGYKFLAGNEYEKDGVMMQGYSISKAYDISQIRMRQPEPLPPKSMEELMGALLADTDVRVQVADNLPDGVQAQYIPSQRSIYVRNGMPEATTFHAINRELACASMDMRDGAYSRAKASAPAFCAAYVAAQKYGVDNTGFAFDKVCQMQENESSDPKELRDFINAVRNAAYTIGKHLDRNLGRPEQEFVPDEFAVGEAKKGKEKKPKSQPKSQPERQPER